MPPKVPPMPRRAPLLLPWWSWASLACACLCCVGVDPRISLVGITMTFGEVVLRWGLLTISGVLLGAPLVSRGPHVPEVVLGTCVLWTAFRAFPYETAPLGPYADGVATVAAICLGACLLYLLVSLVERDTERAS